VAEEHEEEKACAGSRPFGPLEHAGGKPHTRQQRILGEVGFFEELVEDNEDPSFSGFGIDRLRFEPKGCADDETQNTDHGQNLEKFSVKITCDEDGQT
jgi:hypothetical protein